MTNEQAFDQCWLSSLFENIRKNIGKFSYSTGFSTFFFCKNIGTLGQKDVKQKYA